MRITASAVSRFVNELLAVAIIFSSVSLITPSPVAAKTTTKDKSEEKSSSKDSDSKESKTSSKDSDKSSESKASEKDSEESAPAKKKSADEDTDEAEAAPPAPKETPSVLTVDRLPARLSDILQSAQKNAEWGVKIMVAETGQTLFELQPDAGFIPASNRKLFTGALALDQLGPDFTFRTFLYYTGNIDAQGTLNGNLVIVPSGDPTFSSEMYKSSRPDWVFKDWADKVKAAGIRSVNGSLIVDCSAWDMNDLTPQGWAHRVLNDSYAPQTSPLTINENVCNIVVNPGPAGQKASVSFIPAATGYTVNNETVSGKSNKISVNRELNEFMRVSGTVASKTTIWSRPIDRPTLYAAANFRQHLMDAQIPISGNISTISNPGVLPPRTDKNTLAMVQSQKLTEILNYMMKHSNNHMAEQIYVAVSCAKLGKGSYKNSQRLEADLLTRAGVNPSTVHCYDGSGLSESNRVTPSQVCNLLTYMRAHPYAQQYYDSMSISGRDGTLRNRMAGIAGKVHAKTGTINGVKTLSGYLSISPTQTLSFSFLVNRIRNASVSSTQDRLCTTLANLVL